MHVKHNCNLEMKRSTRRKRWQSSYLTAFEHGRFAILHPISMHTRQPSLIKPWRVTSTFVSEDITSCQNQPKYSFAFVYSTLATQKQVSLKPLEIQQIDSFVLTSSIRLLFLHYFSIGIIIIFTAVPKSATHIVLTIFIHRENPIIFTTVLRWAKPFVLLYSLRVHTVFVYSTLSLTLQFLIYSHIE